MSKKTQAILSDHLPCGFLDAMQCLLQDDYEAFTKTISHPALAGLRFNPLKICSGSFDELFPGLTSIAWCPGGFIIPDESQLGKHPYHAAGLYYLQEPSAMAAGEILAPRPGERVLDLCAAPGGKTTHLAALMRNQGLLVANEIHPQRVWELAENMERWGARNTVITNETPRRLADHFGAFFERVLVDAPCSGEGMFRKSAAARRDWSPELVQGCAMRQQDILEQAARLVKEGGWLAYSTCTFNPIENESVIARFLERHTDFELVEIPPAEGFSAGQPGWITDAPPTPALSKTVRIWPQRAAGEGHFIALLRRTGAPDDSTVGAAQARPGRGAEQARSSKPAGRGGSPGIALSQAAGWQSFMAFCQSTLAPKKIPFDPQRVRLNGAYVYAAPEFLPDLGRLKVIHPGWWLGTVKKERFEPSHALALSLQADQVQRVLDYPAAASEISAYLHGETLSGGPGDGWLLVSVDGYPLGWGKSTQGVVKNHYPLGLRR